MLKSIQVEERMPETENKVKEFLISDGNKECREKGHHQHR